MVAASVRRVRTLTRAGRKHFFIFPAELPGFGRVIREAYLVEVPPGQGTVDHFHRRTDELVVLLSGRARLLARDLRSGWSTRREIRPRDALVWIPKNVVHRFVNPGRRSNLLLVLSSRAYSRGHPDKLPVEPSSRGSPRRARQRRRVPDR